ncbi:hypothetical protein C1646_764251 [Rhizophagus diaphanus]|nr:hypothetical protein C1646_764251 [Rhizophagus diaphanus] [Rhizophagus sp. MUCL 43196]
MSLRIRRNFADIEAERAEPKARITKLLKQGVEENKRHDAENAKLKARIIKLEKNKTVTTKLKSENAEFRDRITKVEQIQINNSSSNFNFVAEDCRKSLADEKMDGSFYEKVCFNKEEQMPEVSPETVYEANVIVLEITVPANPLLCEDDRKTDEFLDLVQKKSVTETDSDDDNSDDQSILKKSETYRPILGI